MLIGLFSWLFRAPVKSQTVSRAIPRPVRRCGRRSRTRNTVPFWRERGWKRVNGGLQGFYRTRRGAFKGKIERPFSSSPQFFIWNVPDEVLSGPHGPCFSERGKDVYWIHFGNRPDEVNGGIIVVENFLLGELKP